MATLAEIYAKDGNATPATLAYIEGLNSKLEKFEAELNQANNELAEAQNNYNYANEMFTNAKTELSIAATSYEDAEKTLDAITNLKSFFNARTQQAGEAVEQAENAASLTYEATVQTASLAQTVENTLALANGYNASNPTEAATPGIPYSKGALLETLEDTNDHATVTLTSIITASENSFKSLADAKQVFAMANFLKTGIESAFKQISGIDSRTKAQYEQARRTEHVARLLYNSAESKLEAAKTRQEAAQLRHDLMKAEVETAILGAEGVGSTGK